jgi:hypothetical protein
LFGLGGKMGSFGEVAPASLERYFWGAHSLGSLGSLGFRKGASFAENERLLGFDMQIRDIPVPSG